MRLLRPTRVPRRIIYLLSATVFVIFIYNQFLSYSLLTNGFPDKESVRKCEDFYSMDIDVVYTWVNGSEERFQQEMLHYAKESNARIDSYAPQRFSDKDELKYSLRSLEKHMNWFRHVYIVTNGQIPSWLDLDYERVSVVAHEEIFGGGDGMLPTFSSPAIEIHLHRIQGLSERFIYFNDDVFLNEDVLPEDFHTRNRGFKIYTAWGTDCAHKCEWNYIHNGKCEPACYNHDCDYDAGDCDTYLNLTLPKIEEKLKLNLSLPHINKSKINQNLDNLYENPTNLTNLSTTLVSKNEPINIFSFFQANATNITLHERIERYNNEKIRSHKILKLFQRRKHSARRKLEKIVSGKDLYSSSLIFTQKLLGRMFGYRRRNVIAHAPLMIDRAVMAEVARVFPMEFRKTARKRFRSEENLQIAFIYSYYLALAKTEKTMGEIFHEYDTDLSGTWSDREIHTLMTRIYPLPLKLEMLMEFQSLLDNCSKSFTQPRDDFKELPKSERYADSPLGIITKDMIINCQPLESILKQYESITKTTKYPHEFVEAADHVSFNQLHSLASSAMNTLNSIRRNPRKFVCINDDLDRTNATQADNELLLSLLEDFFQSLFPMPSKFELPPEYRNRFTRIDDLRRWQRTRWRNISTNSYFLALIGFTVMCFVILCFYKRCCYCINV